MGFDGPVEMHPGSLMRQRPDGTRVPRDVYVVVHYRYRVFVSTPRLHTKLFCVRTEGRDETAIRLSTWKLRERFAPGADVVSTEVTPTAALTRARMRREAFHLVDG